MTKIAFFDIDGVLADDRHRVQFALDREWVEYFDEDRMAADAVWREGMAVVQTMQALGWTIAYMTGRREDTRPVTERWLVQHGFPSGELIMRDFTKGIPLANYKADAISAFRVAHEPDAVVLFEDDREVVRFVTETHGMGTAVLCTWHVKPDAMIKAALA